ncbi:hypothetical protein [Gordonia sp. C13]|uniref:hypothetical protein n=1 Tax=Gordonia sp. C13 TaxID=2935078 RepID=UPI0012B756BC|nr:hypothetical protein [Gordonia sp. C13]MCK8616345.1 hypothetical protein [Gordonia sp. C13]
MNRRRGLATIALATAIACVGCSQNDHDDHDHLDHLEATSSMVITPPSLTYPPSLDVDAADPDSVTLGAVRTMYRWRFSTDEDPRDAVRRAEPLLNAPLATQLAAIPPEPFINYRLWDDWKRAGARTDVTATISAERHPADTPTQQQRKVATRITVTDRTGKQLHEWEFAVLAVIQKQAGQWLLAHFQPLGV